MKIRRGNVSFRFSRFSLRIRLKDFTLNEILWNQRSCMFYFFSIFFLKAWHNIEQGIFKLWLRGLLVALVLFSFFLFNFSWPVSKLQRWLKSQKLFFLIENMSCSWFRSFEWMDNSVNSDIMGLMMSARGTNQSVLLLKFTPTTLSNELDALTNYFVFYLCILN